MSAEPGADRTIDWPTLFDAATAARSRAYAPYSRFQVGAALLLADGSIVHGCNVENRAYGLCICAERVALGTAVAAGQRDFVALAVVTDATPAAMPCGQCRESLTELAPPTLPILVGNLDGERIHTTLADLHPYPFEWDGPTHAT